MPPRPTVSVARPERSAGFQRSNVPTFQRFLAVTLLFLGLALLLTWPLPLHLTTHAPGDGSDDPAILWNLWWVKYSLIDLHQSPFDSAWMFWPLGIDLTFYTLTTLNGLISIPVHYAVGVVAANSAIVYFELVIAALGMWLLAHWLMAQHPNAAPFPCRTRDAIALLGAIVFAFGSSKWQYLSLGQFNIASSHWLPWAVLYLGRMWQAPTWRRGLRDTALCALFTLFTGWTEFTYASFFIQFAALFWFWHVAFTARRGDWARVRRYTALCALLGVLFVIGMAPILWRMIAEMRATGDFLVEGLGFANVFSNDLLGFLLPAETHPLLGGLSRGRFAYLNFAFLGWTTLVLAIVALLHRATRRYAASWATMGAAFALLSLGPTLRINGREWELPMPFDLMLQIPLIKANRYPSRYSVLIALCVGVMVVWGACTVVAWLSTRGNLWELVGTRGNSPSPRMGRGVTERSEVGVRAREAVRATSAPRSLSPSTLHLPPLLLLATLLLAEHLGAPLPLSDYRLPPVYQALRGREGSAVLDVPVTWRNGFRVTGALHNSFMFAQAYQTAHHKRLLNGNTSRNPPFKFQYFTELPLLNSLLALETGHELPPERAAADRAIAGELLRLLDAPNIVVRRLDQQGPPVTPARTLPYLEQVLPMTRWHEDADYVGLETTLPAAPASYRFDGAHPLARLFVAEGWSALPPLDQPAPAALPLYAEQAEARLLLPSIAADGDWLLRFQTWLPDGAETPVTLWLRDPAGGSSVQVASLTLRGGSATHEVILPATAPRGTLTELRFEFGARHPAGLFVQGEGSEAVRAHGSSWEIVGARADGNAVPIENLKSEIENLSLLVESAQQEVGDFAAIYVNGEKLNGSGTGYHMVILAPDGSIVERGRFDTFSDPTAAQALVARLDAAPPGSTLLLAAEDTVSHDATTGGAPLSPALFPALQAWGATPTSDMAGRFRVSHAFIGVKGGAPGSAIEDSSAIRPARVWVGAPLTSPLVAARFDWFSVGTLKR